MKTLLLVGCAWFAVMASAKESFWSSLTPEQRVIAGVENLTPQQRDALDALAERFVEAQTVHAVTAARDRARAEVRAALEAEQKGRVGFDSAPAVSDTIRTRIAGEFRGWEKGRLFVLENGQTWVVTDSDVRAFPLRLNPEVEIRPAAFNTWKLHLLPEGFWIRVKRVK